MSPNKPKNTQLKGAFYININISYNQNIQEATKPISLVIKEDE